MEEVSGPVVGIALILARCSCRSRFMGGIPGRLYQQFAITIAISVLISAFNALTLSPALAAMLLRPRTQHDRRCSAASTTASTACSTARRDGYVSVSHALIRKAVVGVAAARRRSPSLAGVLGRAAARRASCPRRTTATSCSTSSCPTRVARAHRRGLQEGRGDPGADTTGVRGYNTIAGFSLLTRVTASQQRLLLRRAQAVGRARRAGRSTRGRSSTG